MINRGTKLYTSKHHVSIVTASILSILSTLLLKCSWIILSYWCVMFHVTSFSHACNLSFIFYFWPTACGLFLHPPVESSVTFSILWETHSLLQSSCVLCTGFSDPYCLLTILEDEEESRTRRSRAKPCKSVVKDAVSDDKIYQTDIKKQTLTPIWNQTFILWV